LRDFLYKFYYNRIAISSIKLKYNSVDIHDSPFLNDIYIFLSKDKNLNYAILNIYKFFDRIRISNVSWFSK
jgi:hypothetical protein